MTAWGWLVARPHLGVSGMRHSRHVCTCTLSCLRDPPPDLTIPPPPPRHMHWPSLPSPPLLLLLLLLQSDSSDEADVLLMHSGGRWPHAWAAASAEPAFSSPAPRPCSLPGTPTSTAVPCGPFRAPSPTPSAGAWHGYGCGYEQSSSSSTSSSPPSSGPPSCSSLAAAAPASCGGTPATAFAAAAMRASSSSNRLSLSGCPPALLVAPPPQKQFSQPLPPLPSSPQQQQVPRRQRLLAASFLTDLVARLLLCLYFFNSAWQAWEMVQRSDVPFPDLTIGEAFPVIKSVALLPCVALVLLGYGVCTSSALLLLDVLGESCLLLHAEM